jgi:hypothetical protein
VHRGAGHAFACSCAGSPGRALHADRPGGKVGKQYGLQGHGKYLGSYVAQFDDRLIGLGGTPQQVAEVAMNYGIRFKKIFNSDGSYSFRHTSNIFVIDPQGRYQVTFSHMSDAYMIASKMLELISERNGS